MSFDDFSSGSESSSTSETQTKYFQFPNPDHPDVTKTFDDPETQRRHFQAAKFIQNQMGPDRHNLVGEFLAGVHTLAEEGDEEHLDTVIEQIKS
jgi:hypothetical protein